MKIPEVFGCMCSQIIKLFAPLNVSPRGSTMVLPLFCMDELKRELKEYINYYNKDRIRLRLNGKSPVQYRTLGL